MFSFYLLTRERPTNKIPNLLLHSTPVILAMNVMVHLRAMGMYNKTRAIELPNDLLSQICHPGNHNPTPIPKTTIYLNGLAFFPCTRPYLVPDERHLCVLPRGLNHSTQHKRRSHQTSQNPKPDPYSATRTVPHP